MVITSKNLQILLPRRISQMLTILMIAFIYEKKKEEKCMLHASFFFLILKNIERKSVSFRLEGEMNTLLNFKITEK